MLETRPDGVHADAAILGTADSGEAFAARYRIDCDAGWRVRRLRLTLLGQDTELELSSNDAAQWTDGSGTRRPDLGGAVDVDISATPFTNTLPIRRLALRAGESEHDSGRVRPASRPDRDGRAPALHVPRLRAPLPVRVPGLRLHPRDRGRRRRTGPDVPRSLPPSALTPRAPERALRRGSGRAVSSRPEAHMRIVVLGGGIAGVTTAYYLATDGARGHARRGAGGRRPGRERGQRGDDRAGAFLRVGVAQGPGDAPALSPRPGDCDSRASAAGPRPLRLGVALPSGVYGVARPAQYPRQAPLCQYSQALMTGSSRTEGIEYHAVTKGALVRVPGFARVHRRPRDRAARGARAAPGSARSRPDSRGSTPRSRPCRRRSPARCATSATPAVDHAVHREAGPHLPGEAGRDPAARHPRQRAPGRREIGSRGGDLRRHAHGRYLRPGARLGAPRSSREPSACGSESTRPRG